jgi:hypothetical protein
LRQGRNTCGRWAVIARLAVAERCASGLVSAYPRITI